MLSPCWRLTSARSGISAPTAGRYFAAATIPQYLTKETPGGSDDPGFKARWDEVRTSYLALLDREDWCDTAREGLVAGDGRLSRLADSVAPELNLRAFLNDRPKAEG
ncbi:MAG: hypothetical protein QOI83_83 [Streptomycetaceae bacterium]|nr:hypothetical protein [Streptomycetaceae bacterium]